MEWQLIVPGRSDELFWNRLRRRELLPSIKGVIRTKTDQRMSLNASRYDEDAELDGRKALFLRDLDEHQCAREALAAFPPFVREERRIVVVRRCLEAWYLADGTAIKCVLPNAAWTSPQDADRIEDPVAKLTALIRQNSNPRRHAGYNKPDFAPKIAEHFDLERAAQRSSSLRRFVQRLAPST